MDAAKRLGVDMAPQASHVDILVNLFEATVEPTLIQPTFITDFPIEISPLARKKESNPALTDRFELFIGGTGISEWIFGVKRSVGPATTL